MGRGIRCIPALADLGFSCGGPEHPPGKASPAFIHIHVNDDAKCQSYTVRMRMRMQARVQPQHFALLATSSNMGSRCWLAGLRLPTHARARQKPLASGTGHFFLTFIAAQGLKKYATKARRWPSHAQRVPKLPDLADPDGCRSPADMPPGQLRKKIFKTSEFVKNELNFFLFSSASTLTQQTLLLTAMSSTGYAPTGVCELASTHSCVLSICSQNNALLSRRCL